MSTYASCPLGTTSSDHSCSTTYPASIASSSREITVADCDSLLDSSPDPSLPAAVVDSSVGRLTSSVAVVSPCVLAAYASAGGEVASGTAGSLPRVGSPEYSLDAGA